VTIRDDDPGGLYLIGYNFRDTLSGRADGDTLDGGYGADLLEGIGGRDLLRGGPGDDTLVGGAARDTLLGDAGADLFRYLRASDSLPTAPQRDRIEGFSAADGDLIDLTAIDASTALARNQAFLWIDGAAFSGRASELRFAAGRLQGDVDGDGLADIEILLPGIAMLPETALLL
jgi:serralysin